MTGGYDSRKKITSKASKEGLYHGSKRKGQG
jgi:hypothetical protein